MAKKKDIRKQYALPKWFWVTLAAVGIVVLALAGWLMFYRTGWPSYLTALHQCEGKPPVQASSFISARYVTPGDESYRIPGGWGLSTTYFCTEAEAIDAGYTRAI